VCILCWGGEGGGGGGGEGEWEGGGGGGGGRGEGGENRTEMYLRISSILATETAGADPLLPLPLRPSSKSLSPDGKNGIH